MAQMAPSKCSNLNLKLENGLSLYIVVDKLISWENGMLHKNVVAFIYIYIHF